LIQGEVYRPDGDPIGAVALIHGGFWQAMYGREGLAQHCELLRSAGYLAANVGYRRLGEKGGGFPNTCTDVVENLRSLGPITAVVGHSAGAQLALWAAKELQPRPRVVICVAGVNDLQRSRDLGYGARQIDAFAGERIAEADPVNRVPIGARTVLVSPTHDYTEGRELTRTYGLVASAAGDDVEIVEPSGDHNSVLDPGSDVWSAVLDAITSV
jgi:acetyl esterase/lipase